MITPTSNPEFLSDRDYCHSKLLPIDQQIPDNYIDLVIKIAKSEGVHLERTEVTNTRYFRRHNRYVAHLIKKITDELIRTASKEVVGA